MLRTIAISLAVLCATCGSLVAQEKAREQQSQKERQRVVYVARHGQAVDLAAALQHFGDDLLVSVEPNSNCLLLNATPQAFEEAIKILERLDRRPASVAIELTFVQLTAKPSAAEDSEPTEGGGEQPLSEALDLSAPGAEVLKKVQDLQRRGLLKKHQFMRLTTLDQQEALVQIGEEKSIVTGGTQVVRGSFGRVDSSGGRGGGIAFAPQTSARQIGTLLRVTPRVTDGAVLLKLDIEKSELDYEDVDTGVGSDDDRKLSVPRTVMTTAQTTISVPTGQTVIVGGVQSTDDSRAILVTAQVLEEAAARD